MELRRSLFLSYIKPKVNYLPKEILAPGMKDSESTIIAYLSGLAAYILQLSLSQMTADAGEDVEKEEDSSTDGGTVS